jgi:hypothetical protein
MRFAAVCAANGGEIAQRALTVLRAVEHGTNGDAEILIVLRHAVVARIAARHRSEVGWTWRRKETLGRNMVPSQVVSRAAKIAAWRWTLGWHRNASKFKSEAMDLLFSCGAVTAFSDMSGKKVLQPSSRRAEQKNCCRMLLLLRTMTREVVRTKFFEDTPRRKIQSQ